MEDRSTKLKSIAERKVERMEDQYTIRRIFREGGQVRCIWFGHGEWDISCAFRPDGSVSAMVFSLSLPDDMVLAAHIDGNRVRVNRRWSGRWLWSRRIEEWITFDLTTGGERLVGMCRREKRSDRWIRLFPASTQFVNEVIGDGEEEVIRRKYYTTQMTDLPQWNWRPILSEAERSIPFLHFLIGEYLLGHCETWTEGSVVEVEV